MENGGDERVKKRAYELWEMEGRPEGKDKEHWSRAESEPSSSEEVTRTFGPDGAKVTDVSVTKRKKTVTKSTSGDVAEGNATRGDNG